MPSNLSSEFPRNTPLAVDYQTSTPCLGRVLQAMEPYWEKNWNNPSNRNTHSGLKAAAAISLARDQLALLLKVKSERIIFTSGATESNNLALLGHARAKAKDNQSPGHLITVSTEHSAVLNPLMQLQREGFRVTQLQPDKDGLIDKEAVARAIKKDTFMISIMMANNEIGVLQPISEIAGLCKDKNIAFHSDAAQAFGYIPFKPDSLGIDFVSLSGHKIYGPKGIGVLVISPTFPIQPLQWGGNQEMGLRPGSLAVPLIIGMAKAAEIMTQELIERNKRLLILRNKLLEQLQMNIPNLIINGSLKKRLVHNLNITIPDVNGIRLHRALKSLISCSSGSACSNGKPSHVLKALGRSKQEAEASIRLSLGRKTSENDIDQISLGIIKTVKNLKN